MIRNILMLCGGRSAEHEVSIISARNILAALDKNQFRPHLVIVSRNGHWYYVTDPLTISQINQCDDTLPNSASVTLIYNNHETFLVSEHGFKQKIDVAFPILHGPMGEDGTIQGMFEVMNLPYVGCGVLASALCMDKAFSKKILASSGIAVAPYIEAYSHMPLPSYSMVSKKLGDVVFVKPALLGSSVGISKVRNEKEWLSAANHAFNYGDKILVEALIEGREVECAILGNNEPEASVIGEIRPTHEFYSYEAKYLDPNGADLIVPAELPLNLAEQVQKVAIDTFNVLGCRGLARVDFFVTPNSKIIVNEVNTIPGFTSLSMYPMLWQHSGVSYPDLITRLIELGYEAHLKHSKVNTYR